ncbi:MAG: PDZ domain-containing protein [Nitrospirota bacterium]
MLFNYKKTVQRSLALALIFFMTGCVSGYQQFYKPFADATTLKDVEILKPDQEPQVFGTNNFDKDIMILRSKRHIAIGESSFNGGYEDESKVKDQARRVGATVVLVNTKYTNTLTTTSPLFLPSSSSTYYSGSVYAGGVSGGYSGSSTTYGTTVVPITTHQRRYDQTAVFFVRSTKKLKFGVSVADLTSDQRVSFERNTGAVVNIVIEDTPAFYSNVLPGDILIEINGSKVLNAKNALELMNAADISAGSASFRVIRAHEEKAIAITFK